VRMVYVNAWENKADLGSVGYLLQADSIVEVVQ
jgi:hypothetical protein